MSLSLPCSYTPSLDFWLLDVFGWGFYVGVMHYYVSSSLSTVQCRAFFGRSGRVVRSRGTQRVSIVSPLQFRLRSTSSTYSPPHSLSSSDSSCLSSPSSTQLAFLFLLMFGPIAPSCLSSPLLSFLSSHGIPLKLPFLTRHHLHNPPSVYFLFMRFGHAGGSRPCVLAWLQRG